MGGEGGAEPVPKVRELADARYPPPAPPLQGGERISHPPPAPPLRGGERIAYARGVSGPDPMTLALEQARLAGALGEVPVGAVLMLGSRVVAACGNATRGTAGGAARPPDPTGHAEMRVLRAAAAALDRERLDDCDLWVTLEPCAMCAGAIGHARIRRLYWAAADPKGGAVEHGPRLFTQATCHHRPELYGGLREADSAALLRDFFARRR